MEQELLNDEGCREDMRLWLAAKEPDEIVGNPMDATSCVVAQYLQSRTGDVWEVIPGARSYWRCDSKGQQSGVTDHMPEWAGHLAFRFDSLSSSEATAKNVLELLDNIAL